MSIHVRRAASADAPAIGAVFDAAVRAGWTFLGEHVQRPMFGPDDWEALVAEQAPLVAIDTAAAVVGVAGVRPSEGELFLLFVHPDHAGRGAGRALLNAAHDALRAAGHREVFLFTE